MTKLHVKEECKEGTVEKGPRFEQQQKIEVNFSFKIASYVRLTNLLQIVPKQLLVIK